METRQPFIGRELEQIKYLILFVAVLACVILDSYVTFIIGKEIVYTHFFYIPFILAGIWYYRKAVYVALFLGAVHVLTTFIANGFGIVTLEALQRAAIFFVVAYVVGFVSEKHAQSLLLEEKKRTEALRKSEEKYHSLVESTEDSVYLVDKNCKYLFMNEKHLSRLELPADQLMGKGKKYRDFHSGEETKEFAEKVKYVFQTGKSLQHEYKESERGYFLKTLSPVKDPKTGAVTAVTVVSKDITELKRAEEKLRETRDYLDNIIESSADTITVVDMNGVVRDWNKGAEATLGIVEKR